MRSWIVGIVALLGCHREKPDTTISSQPAGPVAAGFAEADFVTLDPDGTLGTWRMTPTGVEKIGSTPLTDPLPLDDEEGRALAEPKHGAWSDSDHLFVSGWIGTTKHVKLVTRKGITELPVPDLSTQTPKPQDGQPTGGGKAYTRIDLVVAHGEVWWTQCPWSSGSDGGFCAGWVSAQLWPASTKIVRAMLEPDAANWASVPPPKGYKLRTPTGLRCQPPGVNPSMAEVLPEDGEVMLGENWLSVNPPQFVVRFGPEMEFDEPEPTRWAIYDCEKLLAQGTSPSPGANGLWTGVEGDEVVLRRNATVVGRIPSKDAKFLRVLFRPAR
ncbi:hypothetical protein BH11MYX3_BH11MYX3_04550 [soil metagenome]